MDFLVQLTAVFSVCYLWLPIRMHGRPLYFAQFFSPAVLVGHRAKLNRTLPHVRKQAGFENDCPEFGKPFPRKRRAQNCLFSGGFIATSRLKR